MVPARSNLASILGGQLCAKKTPTSSNISPNPPSTTIKQLQCYLQTPPAKNDHVRKWWWFPNWRGKTYFTLHSPHHLNKRNLLTRTHMHMQISYTIILYIYVFTCTFIDSDIYHGTYSDINSTSTLTFTLHVVFFPWQLNWHIFWHAVRLASWVGGKFLVPPVLRI